MSTRFRDLNHVRHLVRLQMAKRMKCRPAVGACDVHTVERDDVQVRIESYVVRAALGWRSAYLTVGVLQLLLVAVLLGALPLRDKVPPRGLDHSSKDGHPRHLFFPLKIEGVGFAWVAFFFYCGIEAQAVMGFQMAVAYVGSTLLPPLFGFVASAASLALLPWFLAGYAVALLVTSENLQPLSERARAHGRPTS